ncbi:hypothetical protein CI109_103384 [Kwoniella shandongensis]|uniref:Uncharacterized protein n=1 Tax=Kwoniella shandongensis TaxID=1734106 RepID=A0A5M6BWT1_9TREE|nr:uncharacterized protein CI109_004465 [Kwoniella shandongensis]KAA5527173.1 hypothetical protein CI109_004465 [Kwoniella shandongensis]
MTTIERGRGRGGNRGGGGGGPGRGGAEGGGPPRRGAWRGGPPPGTTGSYPNSRGASPVIGHTPAPGSATGPRTSINDHMLDMKKVVLDDKARSGKGFQTDTDISKASGPTERELKPWTPDGPAEAATNGAKPNGGNRDSETFGGGLSNIPWDQFETNERLFGTKTSFQEELYTTKLNKSGADFKKREKEAERLAAEIMGQTAKNSHVAEERGQSVEEGAKDEEEKYSGVVRNPNAYVPPAARKAAGMGGTAPRVSAPPVPSAPKANGTESSSPVPQAPQAATTTPVPASTIEPPPAPARSTSADPVASEPVAVPMKAGATKQPGEEAGAPPAAPTASAPTNDPKPDGQLGGVVDQWRQFVGTEREKVEAKKQSVMKSERERQLADLKKFHTNFKVPLPIPKDILPILAKDATKQKDIEAKATSALEEARTRKAQVPAPAQPAPAKAAAPADAAKAEASKVVAPKKIVMKIPEIPPFNPTKRKAPVLPVPETAGQNIPLAASPTPSITSHASGSQAAKLNPSANAFVFKPNPGAAVFKPGQSSGSPAAAPAAPRPSVSAGPSTAPAPPKNPFFRDKLPERITSVNMRDDFNPWKHGSVPSASSVGLQWPYPGRKHHVPQYGGPVPPIHMTGFEDDPSSPSPHAAPPPLMPGIPPNYPPYYRFNQPGLPPHPGQMQSPGMFSPGPQYAPLPGQPMGQPPPQHIGPGGPPNGMPMYYQNGMPQNPQFLPPQHMQFNPHTPQRHGPGPGGPQMYYQNQGLPTPHQTPQLQHNLPFPGQPPAQPQFQQPPVQMQGPQGGQPGPGSNPGAGGNGPGGPNFDGTPH